MRDRVGEKSPTKGTNMSDTPDPVDPTPGDPTDPELPTTPFPVDPEAPEPTPGVFDPGSVPDTPPAV